MSSVVNIQSCIDSNYVLTCPKVNNCVHYSEIKHIQYRAPLQCAAVSATFHKFIISTKFSRYFWSLDQINILGRVVRILGYREIIKIKNIIVIENYTRENVYGNNENARLIHHLTRNVTLFISLHALYVDVTYCMALM